MVGPIPDDERRSGARRLYVGFVLLVALSAGTTAFYGGASAVEVGLVGLVGLAVGGALLLALGVGR